jgi:release factor glutamine methyltransferase
VSVAGPTVRELVAEIAERLETSGSSSSRVDAELLVAHVLGVPRSAVRASPAARSTNDVARRLDPLVARRAAGEPLQYVLGEWGFRRLTLSVDRRALIPRPETEVVVERCLALLAGVDAPRVLDVGTGSGAIALAIADEHPGALVTGLDASVDALSLARENAVRTGLSIELLEHDLFDGLPAGPWELVVSNPPYVDPNEAALLSREIADWEPPLALYGRDTIEAVAREAIRVLAPDGALVLEVGDGQAAGVAALLELLGYVRPVVTPDLAGRDRVVEARAAS